MRIHRVATRIAKIPLKRPYRIAFATFDHVHNLFVELALADGTLGLGAGSPVEAITGESLEHSRQGLDRLEALLHGEDLRFIETLLRRLGKELADAPAARAAADMALHDLVGKRLGLPLVELFGRVHHRLPTSITLGIRSPEETVDEAREYVDRGFQILKLKTGVGVDEDLAVLRRLREAVGPEITIRVDANRGYGRQDLERFFAEAAPVDVEFVEQPLPARQVEVMRQLPEEIRCRAAADENLHGPADALRLSMPPMPFGIFNIKLMKCGGIAPAREIARIAQLADRELMWGCMDESVVSISAALHTALACPQTRYLDLDGSFDLARDPARGGFVLDNGFLQTIDRPGLGVDLAEGS